MDVSLVLFKKGGERKTFVVPGKRILIGRAKECDFWVPVMSVSRRHCELNIEAPLLHVHDLGSRNGTYVNGMRVTNATLKAGDFLRVGAILFGIQVDGVPEKLSPPDFVLLEEHNGPIEHSSEGSTIIQTPLPGQTQTPARDVADDILLWLNDRDEKNGKKSEDGQK
jgi:pSer/pThr/pTyr-binding forkhead associated (FHA) protein